MDKRLLGFLVFALVFLVLAQPAIAEQNSSQQRIVAKFFAKEGCDYCEEALEYLDLLKSQYPLDVQMYPVENDTNKALLKVLAMKMGFVQNQVPVLIVGEDFHVGFLDGSETSYALIIDQAYRRLEEVPETNTSDKVQLLLFWREGCPHCADEKKYLLPYLEEKYQDLDIVTYDLSEPASVDLLINLSERLGFSAESVPITVVGEENYIGYGSLETSGRAIEDMVKRAYAGESVSNQGNNGLIAELPFIGRIDLREIGVPLATVVIGLVDGFNPCAFFVLMMLLSFLTYAKSRKRMLLIGLTFVVVSGLVYFLFMTATFSVIRALNSIRLVAMVGGAIALIIGLFNIKDFFFFKKGFSFSIPESKKPNLYKRMRGLLKSQSTVELFVGTILLAFIANSYELLCTAGFPIVYGNLLNVSQLDMATSVLYIAFYNVFYVMPLLAIVLIFVKKFSAEKMSEEHGELLKSISGFMMLGFGVFLILDPDLLRNIFVDLGLIVAAVAISITLNKFKKRATGGEELGKVKPPKDYAESIVKKQSAQKAKAIAAAGSKKKKGGKTAKDPETKDGSSEKPEV